MIIVAKGSGTMGHEKKIGFSNVEITIDLSKSGFVERWKLTQQRPPVKKFGR